MIKLARLTTGEFVIADVQEEHDGEIVCKDAVLFDVVQGPVKEGKQTFGIPMQSMVPLATPGNIVTLKVKDVLFWFEDVDGRITKQYNDALSPVRAVSKMPPDLKLVK